MTAVLAFDDAFQIHEEVAPALVDKGQVVATALFAFALVGLLVRYRSFVLRTSFELAIASGALFLASATLDHWLPGLHLLEDGAKFVGIVTWGTWLVGTASVVLGREAPAS